MGQLNFRYSKIIKSIVLVAIAIFLARVVIFFDNGMNGNFRFTRIQISEKDYQAFESRVTSDKPLIKNVYFNDEKLLYDKEDNTFYYSVIEDSTDGYDPIITLLGQKVTASDVIHSRNPRVAIYAEDGAADDNYISGVKLIIYTNNKVSISNLVFTTLPIMNLTISDETMDDLELDETYAIEEYAPAEIYLYDNRADFDNGDEVYEDLDRGIYLHGKIHMRGGTTIDAPQKSYRLSLLKESEDMDTKAKENLLGLREDDDWMLYSAYSDYEKIRTVFSMNLWHDMAENNNEWNASASNEYKYFELFINGRYHGLYALTYPLDAKQFDLQDGETLFKKKDWAGSEFSLDLEYSEYEDGSGGEYILPGYAVQEGDSNAYEDLHNVYYEMAYSEDPATIRATSDIDNAIDLWLFYKLTQAVDNVYGQGVKNLFVATKYSDSGIDGYKLLFAPWDMDQTFGNRYVEGEGSHGISSYYDTPDYDLPMEWSTVYFLMEYGDDQIVDEVKARYAELRAGDWSDKNISAIIDEYESEIYDSGAFDRTENRWPDGNYYDEGDGLEDFEDFVIERLECMDDYIADL